MSSLPQATAEAGSALPPLVLKHHEERRLQAGHLWVFSNEIDVAATPLTGFAPGAQVQVLSSGRRFLGYAYVNPRTLICARLLGRAPGYPPGKSLLVHRLKVALALRQRLSAAPFHRLVYGEGDFLPGLVVDRYGDVVVAQAGTAGMEAMQGEIQDAIVKVVAPKALLWKNDSPIRELEGLPRYVETAFGEVPDAVEVPEGGVSFRVPL
ncbi:MAG: class I SAM-dependent rRNA methyltransferase, partial [Steroidobacteraceae bacterium]